MNKIVILCTGGLRQATDFGLKAGVSYTTASVVTTLDQQLQGMAKFESSPEGTRQQVGYLACIDRRMLEWKEARIAGAAAQDGCTEATPCVDVTRVADFTDSSCEVAAEGKQLRRVDLAVFHDTLVFTPKTRTQHTASALPNGDGVALTVRRSENGQVIEVPSTAPDCAASGAGCKFGTRQYVLPVTDGQLEFDWVWTNGHGADTEALTILPSAQVRSMRAQVIMPAGVDPSNFKITPPTVAAKCVHGYRNVVCRGLTGAERTQLVSYIWDWNMWSRCRARDASASAASASAQNAVAPPASQAHSVPTTAAAVAARP